MKCPVCREPMIILELRDVEIDYCTLCGGIWLDSGEIERLLDGAGQKDTLLHSFQNAPHCGEKPYPCPICRKPMDKVSAGNGSLIIDRCAGHHGLWFDKGELRRILEIGFGEQGGRVLNLLKDIFGETETKET